MDNKSINDLLNANYDQLVIWSESHGIRNWTSGPKNKWTGGQHVLHLVQSTKPLLKGISMPKFLLKYKFGKCNRPIRSYEEVVKNYHNKLSKVVAVSPFSQNMPETSLSTMPSHLEALKSLNNKLSKTTLKLKDKHLDVCLLPHPLMGRMTLREILIWNAYHLKHHTDILNEKYTK